MIAVGNDKLFALFARVLGHPEWAEDPRFRTNPDRVHHRAELYAFVDDAIGKFRTADLQRALDAAGEVRPPACRASKRLSTEAARSAAHALMGPEMPLRSCAPRSSNWKRLPTSFLVLSAMTTLFGSAMPCKRAVRLGVSPTMACS